MIVWRNRPIETLSRDELRIALEDAADELIRTRATFAGDQVSTTLAAGFASGAALTCLVMLLVQTTLR
jgi:hypothetical protein